ncbi:hypothetical protein FHU38_004759 [Saccharomonospora amisosensis]|uniref:DUF1707 domain-containing protein n=1 Tax=Saccharomonospora amisosensis TaxID=1128677 RepID=A0A7X5UUD5_9PSEU|nr:DUF1707 domain-containing protein [Saccharomonospora amisosensis]NIJ14358.1 hypothetical protein [Saccharomonospora amisosensis]
MNEAEPDETKVPDEQERLRNLRVSDAEREHVVELLQQAIGRGLLDLDEFTERTDTALAARTRGELNTVLIDLPGLVHPDATMRGGHTSPPEAARTAPGQRVKLRAHGSSLVRKGNWFVPAELLVVNKYGETKLDFSEAEIAAPVVHVELDTKWSAVHIVIPEQAAVDLNGLTELKWSSIDDKTNSAGKLGSPRFVFTGKVTGGSLSVRYPRRGWFSAC